MKAWCLCVAAVIASCSGTLPAQDDPAAIASKIAAMEKVWSQAFKLRDAKAVDGILADDAVLINDDGSMLSKPEFLSLIRAAKASEEEQVTPESISVRVQGDVAIATGVFRSKGMRAGKPYDRKDRFSDTWKRRGDSWVCVSATATPVLH